MKFWNLKGKNVLIIDDFDEMRAMVRSMVTPLTPDVVKVAKSGEEAIEQLASNKFDLVLCDYNLGKGKDGQQILEEARHRGLLPYSALFVMITAENTSEMVMGAIDYLPDDYISKPFTKNQLHQRLERLFGKKQVLADIAHAVETKEYDQALRLCDEKLKQDPKNRFELLRTRGEILMKLGQLDEAVDLYENLLEERDIPWAQLALGQAYYQKQEYEEAQEVFEGLISDNPANVSAYDWLSKTLEQMGDLKEAQEMLAQAVEKSPKSLLRQSQLGEIAYKNSDYETSQQAYESALSYGRHSCYKKPQDYSGLAKCMMKQGKLDDAMKTVERLGNEFDESPETQFHAATMNSLIYKEKGDEEKCKQALESALGLFQQNPNVVSSDLSLELTETCLSMGMQDEAKELVTYVVKNHHDDQAILDQTKAIFDEAGLASEGETLIKETKDEVVNINNEGARLLQEGKLEESIELFIKAARGMPDNTIINLNAAYSMILQMQKTGKIKKYLQRTMKLLDHVKEIDPTNKKYSELLKMVQNLSKKKAA